MNTKMIIGLDFDGTITRDPAAFKQMVKTFRDAGHTVYITTMRYQSELIEPDALGQTVTGEWGDLVDGIYATGRMAKAKFMQDQGINVDIWIDDNPQAVHKNASEIWGYATPEGVTVLETARGPMLQVSGYILGCDNESWQVVRAYLVEKRMTLAQFLDVCYDPKVKAYLQEKHLHCRVGLTGKKIATHEETIVISTYRHDMRTGAKILSGTHVIHPNGSTSNVSEPGISVLRGDTDQYGYSEEITVLPIVA